MRRAMLIALACVIGSVLVTSVLIKVQHPERSVTERDIILRPDNLTTSIGRSVVIRGIASNAKQGAMVEMDFVVVAIDGLSEWPRATLGKHVEVDGVLGMINYGVNPESGSSALATRAGATGVQYVLTSSKWHIKRDIDTGTQSVD